MIPFFSDNLLEPLLRAWKSGTRIQKGLALAIVACMLLAGALQFIPLYAEAHYVAERFAQFLFGVGFAFYLLRNEVLTTALLVSY